MLETEVDIAPAKVAEEKQNKCDHGINFDLDEAKKISDITPTGNTVLEYILGSPAHSIIRKRWPRLNGPCPKGCGYSGIYYASWDHYLMGDW